MIQKRIILNVLREAGIWVKSYDLQKVSTRYGWLGTSADRQARELAEKALIDRRQVGKYAEYRFKTPYKFGEQKISVQERRVIKHREVRKSLQDAGQEELFTS